MSYQRSSNREVKPAKTFSWHTYFCIFLSRLNTSLGSHAFTIFQSRIAKSPEIHTISQRVAVNRSCARPPWELLPCAGLQYWLHVRVLAMRVLWQCQLKTTSFCQHYYLLFIYQLLLSFFLSGTIRRWSLSPKNGGFKVDLLWHSGHVCLVVTRCYLVFPEAQELPVLVFHLASNYSIRFRLAWLPGRSTIHFMFTVISLENQWMMYLLLYEMFGTCKASSSFLYSIW